MSSLTMETLAELVAVNPLTTVTSENLTTPQFLGSFRIYSLSLSRTHTVSLSHSIFLAQFAFLAHHHL